VIGCPEQCRAAGARQVERSPTRIDGARLTSEDLYDRGHEVAIVTSMCATTGRRSTEEQQRPPWEAARDVQGAAGSAETGRSRVHLLHQAVRMASVDMAANCAIHDLSATVRLKIHARQATEMLREQACPDLLDVRV